MRGLLAAMGSVLGVDPRTRAALEEAAKREKARMVARYFGVPASKVESLLRAGYDAETVEAALLAGASLNLEPTGALGRVWLRFGSELVPLAMKLNVPVHRLARALEELVDE